MNAWTSPPAPTAKPAPRHIVEELRRFDSRLRLRWSRQKRKFVLERKTHRSMLFKPVRYSRVNGQEVTLRIPEWSDRYIQYRDGFMEVLETKNPDRRLFWALYAADSRRKRTNYLRDMENAEDIKEERENAKHSEILSDVAGSTYEKLLYRQGERISMRR